ncbi:hypothetical protein BASA81_007584 [Batrachochytrium salamandrivorans]|nr:hypothetical protein BASA81_007584 [Batrachochytrium salamandrivorans]
MEILTQAFTSPSNKVTELALRKNNIEDSEAQSIATALQHGNNKITALYIERNKIHDAGATAIAEALQGRENCISKLNLSRNWLCDKGAVSLAQALQRPQNRVTELWFGKSGVNALEQAFWSSNCKLAKVKVLVEDPAINHLPSLLHNIKIKRRLLVSLSARCISRIGTKSALRKLPSDLIRLTAGMIQVGLPNDEDLDVAFESLELSEGNESSDGNGGRDEDDEADEGDEADEDDEAEDERSYLWHNDDVHYTPE